MLDMRVAEPRSLRARITLLCVTLLASFSFAERPTPATHDAIEGVEAAALDQPRIYINLRRTANGAVLKTAGQEQLSGIEAFLDTGASGCMLSKDSADKLGIKAEKASNGQAIVFEDVGVAGSEQFSVSEPLFVATAAYPKSDPETADYSTPVGPFRTQIRPNGGLLELIAPGLDVAGVPVMSGKVVVMDPTPLAKFDKIHTTLVAPADRSIPKTSRHVALTPVSFARFTRIKPTGANGPALAPNPMIGPDPFKADDRRQAVRITYHGHTVSATFLLDTGAVTSIISTKLAKDLNIRVLDSGDLPDLPASQKFQLTLGGLGGGKQSTGLFVDRVELPTTEGKPIAYAKAPLLISDITVADEQGKPFTLDGVLGMNYFVASAEISGGLLPDVGKLVDGPFRWIVIDLKRGVLGLEPTSQK